MKDVVHVIESGQEKLKHSTIEKTLFVPSKKLNCCFSADRTGQPATDAPRNQSHAQTSTSGQPKKSHKFWRVGKAVKAVSRLFVWRDNDLDIGYPTDVKHVAHIGWDGPSINGPGWVCDLLCSTQCFSYSHQEFRSCLH
jgi:hypothetical protein